MVNVARTLTSSRHSLRTLEGTHDPTAVFGHHLSPDPDALYIYSDVEFVTKWYLLWVVFLLVVKPFLVKTV